MADLNNENHSAPKRFWKQLLSNPVVLGAIITAYVTLNTAIFGYLSSRNAQRLEKDKFEFAASLDERKYETSLILQVANSTGQDHQLLMNRLCLLVATGLLPQAESNLKGVRGFTCPEIGEKLPLR